MPVRVEKGDEETASSPEAAEAALPSLVRQAEDDRAAIEKIEKGEIGDINYRIEKARLRGRKLELLALAHPERDLARERAEVLKTAADQKSQYDAKTQELATLMERAAVTYLVVRTSDGQEKELRTLDIYRAYPANRLSGAARLGIYGSRLWGFFSEDPRESNTEGGIFPAIFGTVMMVLLMSLMVVPLGVLAALYLREYAKQGTLVRTVRIAVNNLAGRALDRLRRLRPRVLRLLRGRRHRPAVLPGSAADADLRHRRHPLGFSDAGAAHRARRDRGHGRGAGGGAPLRARSARSPWAPPSSRRSCAWCCPLPRRAS